MCIAEVIITSILQVHFGEDQFEKNREDGRKLLRPFAVPNLLYKNTNNEEEDNSKKAGSSNITDVKDIDSCKFYIMK